MTLYTPCTFPGGYPTQHTNLERVGLGTSVAPGRLHREEMVNQSQSMQEEGFLHMCVHVCVCRSLCACVCTQVCTNVYICNMRTCRCGVW